VRFVDGPCGVSVGAAKGNGKRQHSLSDVAVMTASRHTVPMCKARFPIVALLVAMLAGCATTDAPDMRVDYDRKADFSVYRTFGFPKETGTDRGGYSTLITSYFKNSVTTAMEARGYKYSAENPDLLVNFYMNTRDRTESRPTPGGYYRYRDGLYGGWPMYPDDRTITYQVGTINLDIVDAAKKQLIWEGVSEGVVTEESLANPKVKVNAVVTELMRRYPGKPNM
jgi:uncharacterized protein DUF4136